MTSVASDVAAIRDDEGIVLRSCCSGQYGGHVLRSLQLLPKDGQPPKGMIIFVHGTFQHSRAVELADLQQRCVSQERCAWLGLDAPGHGLSGRLGDPSHPLAPALVPNVDAFVDDLRFFIAVNASAAEFSKLPIVIMGHSWGTSLMTVLLPQLQESLGPRLRGACYSSATALPVDMPDPRMLPACPKLVLRVRAFCSPEAFPGSKGNLDIQKVARDPAMRKQCAADQLRYHAGERPYLSSLSWEEANIYKRAGTLVPQLRIPLCITTGSADKAVSPLCGPNLYCESMTPTALKSFRLLPDATHNLFADPHRGALMDDWCAFVRACVDGEFAHAEV